MKTELAPYIWISGQSLGASFNSPAMEVIAYYGLSLEAVITGSSSLNGSLTLQMSNDSTNWVDVPTDATYAVNPKTVTADGGYFWEYAKIISYKWMRLKYTRTGGSGTLNVWVSGVRV